jgi:hypothetical protein
VLRERGTEIVFSDEASLDQALTDFLAHYGPSGIANEPPDQKLHCKNAARVEQH